jgi:hypothetical protein
MHRLARSGVLVALSAVVAGCASPMSSAAPASTPTPMPSRGAAATPDASDPVAEELADLVRLLEQTHPEPYHSVARDEFRAALDEYAAELPGMTDAEAVVGLMRVWGMLSRDGRDGHQFALPVDEHAGPILPIRIYEFAEGVHVTAAVSQHEDLVGARLTSIGGVPIEDVLAAVEPLVPRDGPATVPAFRPILLLRSDVLAGLGVIGGESVVLGVELPDGGEREVSVEPMPLDAYLDWAGIFGLSHLPIDPDVAYLADPAPFSATLLEGGVAYLRYRLVSAPDLDEVRDWIEAGSVERLILDLRQNPGGDNSTFAALLTLVTDFAAVHPGALAVITDRITFSAAANLATRIEQATDAVFVGEPMGGGLNFWDDVGWMELDSLPVPMKVAISTRWWQFADADDPRLTIDPDVGVAVTASDHFSARDPALDAALEAIGAAGD